MGQKSFTLSHWEVVENEKKQLKMFHIKIWKNK